MYLFRDFVYLIKQNTRHVTWITSGMTLGIYVRIIKKGLPLQLPVNCNYMDRVLLAYYGLDCGVFDLYGMR